MSSPTTTPPIHGKYSARGLSRWQLLLRWSWVTLWCCLHYASPLYVLSGLLAPLVWGAWSLPTALYLGVLAALCLYPHRPWPRARQLFRCWFELFELEYVVELDEARDLTPGLHYIACWSPHGIVPLGGYMGISFFDLVFPQYYGASAVASVLFRLPFLRQVLLWCGAVPSSRAAVKEALRRTHLSIMPGGIAELFLSSREREVVFLRDRDGIVRVALEEGAPILPIYVFGQTQCFDQASFPLARLSRSLQASLSLFYGRGYLPVPYPAKIVIVMGKPLPLPRHDRTSTPQDVALLKQQWEAEVVRIYETYKHLANYPPEKKLEIH